jgi:uncharacterized protein YecE (DUF72 family)
VRTSGTRTCITRTFRRRSPTRSGVASGWRSSRWIEPASYARCCSSCARILDGYHLAVEFRNRSWLDEQHRNDVIAFERDLGLTHVVVDEPQGFSSSVPAIWEATNPKLAIFRLHGRNARTWEKKGLAASSERVDYEYSEAELRELVAPVKRLSSLAGETHVIFNVNLRDQGVRGARAFSNLLQE